MQGSSMDLPKPIVRDFVTRHDVLVAGGDDRDIRAAIRAGEITAVRAGAYVSTNAWLALDAVERHRLRTRIVLHQRGTAYAATHTSSAVEHDIDLYGQDLSVVHLTHRCGGRGRRENGIVYHEGPIGDESLTEIDGALYSNPTRAMWEVALISSVESALVSLDCALRLKSTSKNALHEIGGPFRNWSRSRNARLAILLCDGRSGSVGESRSRYQFVRHGIPAPELQYEVRNSNGILIAYTDFAWLEYRHVGEFDGHVKYDLKSKWVKDPKFEVIKEKLREDEVRDELLGFSRWGWAELDPPRLDPWLRGLQRSLERSRRLYTRNGVHIPLR